MNVPLCEGCCFPRLIFEYGFDEREAWEAKDRGFRSHVTVEFEDRNRYPISFYDPVALKQEVERGIEWRIPCVAEPGMIVIPEITLDNMRAAVTKLIGEGFFDHFRPVSEMKSSGS